MFNFFNNNPEQLKTLIGDLDKSLFFSRIRDKVYNNLDNGKEYEMTRDQMLDVITSMIGPFFRTKFGLMCLN
jgi:hypothetical protein